jgi:hypothetical protein
MHVMLLICNGQAPMVALKILKVIRGETVLQNSANLLIFLSLLLSWVLYHIKSFAGKFLLVPLGSNFSLRRHTKNVLYLLFLKPEPEFRPPMSEVVQQLVRLMQRASIVRRQSGEELGFSYRAPEREGDLRDLSF